MDFLIAFSIIVLWPLSAVLGQNLAARRGRDKELWLFLCGLGGPPVYLLLRFLPQVEADKKAHDRAGRVVALLTVIFFVALFSLTGLRACFY